MFWFQTRIYQHSLLWEISKMCSGARKCKHILKEEIINSIPVLYLARWSNVHVSVWNIVKIYFGVSSENVFFVERNWKRLNFTAKKM